MTQIRRVQAGCNVCACCLVSCCRSRTVAGRAAVLPHYSGAADGSCGGSGWWGGDRAVCLWGNGKPSRRVMCFCLCVSAPKFLLMRESSNLKRPGPAASQPLPPGSSKRPKIRLQLRPSKLEVRRNILAIFSMPDPYSMPGLQPGYARPSVVYVRRALEGMSPNPSGRYFRLTAFACVNLPAPLPTSYVPLTLRWWAVQA